MWNPFRTSSPPPPEPEPVKPKLPLFSETSSCTKCVGTNVATSFWDTENVMVRRCRRCDASWHEAPLDADR